MSSDPPEIYRYYRTLDQSPKKPPLPVHSLAIPLPRPVNARAAFHEETMLMRYIYSLLLFCLLAVPALAQGGTATGVWLPVTKDTFLLRAEASVVMNGMLYVVAPYSATSTVSVLWRWDGTSWDSLSRLYDGTGGVSVSELAVYRGELYISGSFDAINNIPGTAGIARWDGTAWKSVGGGTTENRWTRNMGSVGEMIEFGGKLAVAGGFEGIGDATVPNGLATWDGTRWEALPGNSYVHHDALAINNGTLYSAGYHGIFMLDSGRWIDIDGGRIGLGNVRKMTFYRNELWAIADSGIFVERGNQWKAMADIEYKGYLARRPALVPYGGSLFVSGMKALRDSNRNSQYGIVERWDGERWESISEFNADINFLAEYRGELYAGGEFTKHGPMWMPGMARLCGAASCARISGTIFHDADGDCTQDAAEAGLANRIIEILPGPLYATSNHEGKFSSHLPPGTYTVAPVPVPYWNASCAPAGRSVVLPDMGDAAGVDFPLTPQANVRDLRVSIASGPARPGFPVSYTITYENIGTVPAGGTIRLLHDRLLTIEASAPPPGRTGPGSAEWDFDDLLPGSSGSITIRLLVPRDKERGSDLCASAAADYRGDDRGFIAGDSICTGVTGSFDPNDIRVSPDGDNGNGVLAEGDSILTYSILTYSIRFQNTGTDTAFTVIVIDTLAPELAAASIRPGAASHPSRFTLDAGGAMTWTFSDIRLPDSGRDEPASHGYLKYSVRLRHGLPPGTEIPNRASIYFDFNEPVATNTVISSIMEPQEIGGGLRIYPNPTLDIITIDTPVPAGAVVELRNVLGQPALRRTVENEQNGITLDLSGLPGGAYTVVIRSANGTYQTGRTTLLR